jgi:hypothetical protein
VTTSLLASIVISQLIILWIAWIILRPQKSEPTSMADQARLLGEASRACRDARERISELDALVVELQQERDAYAEENDALRSQIEELTGREQMEHTAV